MEREGCVCGGGGCGRGSTSLRTTSNLQIVISYWSGVLKENSGKEKRRR